MEKICHLEILNMVKEECKRLKKGLSHVTMEDEKRLCHAIHILDVATKETPGCARYEILSHNLCIML